MDSDLTITKAKIFKIESVVILLESITILCLVFFK